MPKCSEGYVTRRVRDLMLGVSVTAIAQELKENLTGTADTLDVQQMADAEVVLEFYVKHWVHNTSVYDALVFLLLKEVRRLYWTTPGTDEY